MPNADLGQARDAITEIERTSGTGSAGTIDTYSVWTETHPKSGGVPAGTFQVRNGANGNSGFKEYTDVISSASDVTSLLSGYLPNHEYIFTNLLECSYLMQGNIYRARIIKRTGSFELFVQNGQPDEWIQIAAGLWDQTMIGTIKIIYADTSSAVLDSALNASSTNPVENAGIVEGISAHNILEEFDNLDEALDGALAYLKTNVAKDVKKVYCPISDSSANYITAVWYEGNFDTNVYILRYSVYNQTAGNATDGIAVGNTGSWVIRDNIKVTNDVIPDNEISGDKINGEKLFTEEVDLSEDVTYVDGKYVQTSNGAILTYNGLSYGEVDVEGYEYVVFSCYIGIGNYNLCCIRDKANAVISESVWSDDLELIQDGAANENKVLRLKLPANSKKFYYNIWTSGKATAVIKVQNYDSTKKMEWIAINGNQIDDESIYPRKIFKGNVIGGAIAGTYKVGAYFNQTSNAISYNVNQNIAYWYFPVEGGKKYRFYASQGQSVINVKESYFIFATRILDEATNTRSSYTVENADKLNYIEDLGDGYFDITMPIGTNYFYTASAANNLTNGMNEITQVSLDWLKLKTENFAPNSIPKEALITEVKYKYWDNLNKPFDFNGKTLVAFGDSITDGTANEGSGNYNAGNNKYISLFAAKFGMTLNNQAVGGSRFTAGGLSSIATKITGFTFANTSSEVIIIAGGTNDFNGGAPLGQLGDTTDATFYGALDVVCQYLTANANNSTVIFITPINVNRAESAFPNHTNHLNDYRNAIWEVATKYKFNVVDGSTIGFADEVNTPWGNLMIAPQDGTHPTLAGHALYFRGLCGKLDDSVDASYATASDIASLFA